MAVVALSLVAWGCGPSNGAVGLSSDGATEDVKAVGAPTLDSTADPADMLTPNERRWASQLYHCIGVHEFDKLVVRRSTLVDVHALLGGDFYTLQPEQPVWVVAFTSGDRIDVIAGDTELPAYPAPATPVLAADVDSGAVPPRADAIATSMARSRSNTPTTGYCAFKEEGDWMVKEMVPPAMAEVFMAGLEKMPRLP